MRTRMRLDPENSPHKLAGEKLLPSPYRCGHVGQGRLNHLFKNLSRQSWNKTLTPGLPASQRQRVCACVYMCVFACERQPFWRGGQTPRI